MKSTEYFRHTRMRPDRLSIKDEWIQRAIDMPVSEEVQADGRLRRWVYMHSEGKSLGVFLLEDGETVHNAFFDRSYKP